MPASSVSRLLGGLGAAGLLVGGALGFTLLRPDDSGGSAATVDVQQYSLYDCPDGAATGSAYAGDRVFVIGRDESGGWYEIRDPRNQSSVVWVPTGAVNPDEVIDVPVHECAEPIELIVAGAETTTTVLETTTTVGQTTVPGTTPVTTKNTTKATTPATTPQGTTPQGTTPATSPPTTPTTAAPDTTKPIASSPGRSPDTIYDAATDNVNCPETSTLTVTATDNVAVTGVTGTYSGVGGSPKAFTKGAGNTWSATFGPFSGLAAGFNSTITIVIVARDAAGNTSNAVQTSVTVNGAGNCLG
ncbi:MAG: hypothetical protein K8R99_06345 [Actinomycetia bacterium]|nr:hypothetical protein [Actinomycetes bacterium]